VALDGDDLHIDIADDGCGQIAECRRAGHYGLSGMRERVQALGGEFQLLQRDPAGITIAVRLPLVHSEMQ
jgi:two-component system sensor histidine kinase UhpB